MSDQESLRFALPDHSMRLDGLELKPEYRSDSDSLIEDFYVPCLMRSRKYLRAVGYFTSWGLSVAAQGLTEFIANGGEMYLVASPLLEPEDIDAIERGYAGRLDTVTKALLRQFEPTDSSEISDRLGYLAWLISEHRLEIKIAMPVSLSLIPKHGIYHEKLGIFVDSCNLSVAFTGSPNETSGGLVDNFEAIDVFWSWDDPHGRVRKKHENFKRIWENSTVGLSVVDFPNAVRQELLRYKPNTPPVNIRNRAPVSIRHSQTPVKPKDLCLRQYQEEAISNWFNNNGRGTLKMATGSGKTLTALAALERLYSSKVGLRCVIIICPYQHLVLQWEYDCRRFGLTPLLAFESQKNWRAQLTEELNCLSDNVAHFLTILTTNATFSSEAFQRNLQHFPDRTLLIADEAHNLGATRLLECLPINVGWRLALSATPERWYDDEGTEALLDYFGEVLQPEFTLKDALDGGILTPYRYYPILVHLTEHEAIEYSSLTEKIVRISIQSQDGCETTELLKRLLVKRARIVATAHNKLESLRRLVSGLGQISHALFYCGDGSVGHEQTGETMRQVDAVTYLLGQELGLRVAKYTAETTLDARSELRERFDQGEVQALVAIRCLDEGVDIPSIRVAVILASSTNPRQFIQRRGRLLRRSPGKEFAKIYDMVTLPPQDDIGLQGGKALLRREFERLAEFSSLSLNCGEARGRIIEIQKRYGLLDI